MDWTVQDLGAIGEVVGSVAVLATLVYLSVQTRLSRKESSAAYLRERTSTSVAMLMGIATSDSLAESMTLAGKRYWLDEAKPNGQFAQQLTDDGLTPVQIQQVYQYLYAQLRYYISQYELGDKEDRLRNEGLLRFTYGTGIQGDFWNFAVDKSAVPSASFAEHLDRLLQ